MSVFRTILYGLLSISAVGFPAANAARFAAFKSVDEKGVVEFSQMRPMDRTSEVVQVTINSGMVPVHAQRQANARRRETSPTRRSRAAAPASALPSRSADRGTAGAGTSTGGSVNGGSNDAPAPESDAPAQQPEIGSSEIVQNSLGTAEPSPTSDVTNLLSPIGSTSSPFEQRSSTPSPTIGTIYNPPPEIVPTSPAVPVDDRTPAPAPSGPPPCWMP